MPGKPRGESKYNSPEALNDLKERLRTTNVPGINPLQTSFVIAVIDVGGWGEISPLQQERLDEYLTTEKSQTKIGKEQGVKDIAIRMSNIRAIETLHSFFVKTCPDRADDFPLAEVRKGKDPAITAGRPKEPNSRRSKAERRRRERMVLSAI